MTRHFDPIELELFWRRLISIVDEAAAALVRTSFSTLVRESYDFSCVITDAAGQSLVQATESIPSFIGTLPGHGEALFALLPPEQLMPGDVLITNDIWLGTGHLPTSRWPSRSSATAGWSPSAPRPRMRPISAARSRSPEPREVFEEGLQIPPLKLIAAGETDETLVAMIRKNVRTPDQTLGDLWAQVVALDLMEDRLLALMAAAGLDDLTDLAREIQGRCEAAMRSAISALPDGTYRSELETDGLNDRPITLRMALTVNGDEITMDFAGTDAQVDRAINCAFATPTRWRCTGSRSAPAPRLPNNEGAWRPISADRAARLHRQSVVPCSRRLAHADRPLPADAGVRLPRPDRAGAGDGGLRVTDVGHEPVGRSTEWAALRQHVLLQRRHGRQHGARRHELPVLAVQRLVHQHRDQRAHRATALPPQEAAPGQWRRWPASWRARAGGSDRKPSEHPDRRVVPGRAHDLPGLRDRRRRGRRAGRTAHQRRPD